MPASIQVGGSAAGPQAGRSRSCLSPRAHSDDNEGPAELIEGQGHGAAPSAARSAAQRFSSLLPVKEVGAAAPGSRAGVLWQTWCVASNGAAANCDRRPGMRPHAVAAPVGQRGLRRLLGVCANPDLD